MKAIELKQELILRISGIEDIEFLKAIKTILDYRKRDSIMELSPELEVELRMASDEGKKGKVTSQEELDIKVEKWLDVR